MQPTDPYGPHHFIKLNLQLQEVVVCVSHELNMTKWNDNGPSSKF